MSAPSETFRLAAIAGDAKATPRVGVVTCPSRMSCGTAFATLSMGIAKPTPADVPVFVNMAVFTPITRPLESRRGPPLLPGLMAASVWIPPDIVLPALRVGWRLPSSMVRDIH